MTTHAAVLLVSDCRIHGHSCYADVVLQHSLLSDGESAAPFCQQLAEALRPAAQNMATHVQQRQQQQGSQAAAGEAAPVLPQHPLSGSDLPYQHHQVSHVAAGCWRC